MAFALGGRIIDFSVLPWLWVAEPYLCDVLTFVIGYIWASKIQPASPPLDDVCLAFWCRNKRFNDQLISGESFFCRLSDRDILRVFAFTIQEARSRIPRTPSCSAQCAQQNNTPC